MVAKINVSQASRMFGKDRKTIHRAIEKYSITTERSDNGQTLLQLVDLISIWGEPKNSDTPAAGRNNGATPQDSPLNATPIFQQQIKELEKQVNLLEEDREERKKREEDLRHEKGELLSIVKQQGLMLEYKREKPEEQPKSDRWLIWGLGAFTVIIGAIAIGAIYYLIQSGA